MKCQVCAIDYEYTDDKGYSREYCSSFCHGRLSGMVEIRNTLSSVKPLSTESLAYQTKALKAIEVKIFGTARNGGKNEQD